MLLLQVGGVFNCRLDTKTAEGKEGEKPQEKRLCFNDILAYYRIHGPESTFLTQAFEKTIGGIAAEQVYVMPKYSLSCAIDRPNDMQADNNNNGHPRIAKTENIEIMLSTYSNSKIKIQTVVKVSITLIITRRVVLVIRFYDFNGGVVFEGSVFLHNRKQMLHIAGGGITVLNHERLSISNNMLILKDTFEADFFGESFFSNNVSSCFNTCKRFF